ncbi:MAG: SPOR domain-containing protein [Candidatus Obscuribacterales bacterium]|nr:SPOR domain-containing protein [Steroidobacteraceae bacterium]
MARDYKNAKRAGKTSSSGGSFFIGLALGLAVAGGVHVYHRQADKQPPRTASESTAKDEQRVPASQNAEPQTQFDFYEALPKFEVVVPERDKDVQRNAPGSRVEKPGAYILQAGSYRQFADADRVRATLALQGVESKVSKVTIDTDTWHRVRIGPLRDLKNLEDTRRKLRETQIDAIVIRVGD